MPNVMCKCMNRAETAIWSKHIHVRYGKSHMRTCLKALRATQSSLSHISDGILSKYWYLEYGKPLFPWTTMMNVLILKVYCKTWQLLMKLLQSRISTTFTICCRNQHFEQLFPLHVTIRLSSFRDVYRNCR